MSTLKVDFSKSCGTMKPMHAVNNGPVYKFTEDQRITNLPAFQEAGIPYARTHDAAFYSSYGGEHTVDILAIFPDFDADENDPASYDFVLTDEYLKVMEFAGVKPFYRLGSKIEHWPKKYGTKVPKDYLKWAKICEHIIRHYNEGWADGFHMDIDYWEIWNEPDGAADDAPEVWKKCWGGTRAQFCEFFDVAAKHLKACFPDRKIGGPAVCYPITDWVKAFLPYLRDHNTPLDFFSWHSYVKTPAQILATEVEARALLDSYGFTKTESILNEWNYVKDWVGDAWLYSLRMEKALKGSSLIAGTIAGSQYRPMDLLMYYDARPCGMNGMFSTDFVCDKLKGYYPFLMFGTLYRMGTAVPVETENENIYACAARGDGKRGLMLTHYQDEDEAAPAEVTLELDAITDGKPAKLTFRVLDEKRDDEIVWEETVTGRDHRVQLRVPLFTTMMVTAEDEA